MTPDVPGEFVAGHASATLVAEVRPGPFIKIRPGRSNISRDLREMWSHRELLYFLIWRDLKVRYRQTFVGIAWVILQPALMTLVFTIFLSKLGRFSAGSVPYPLFAYAALLPWTFFSNSVSAASASLISHSYIITRVYFPRLIIPAAMVGVRVVDFLFATVVLIPLMIYYGVSVGRSIVMLPAVILLTTFFTFAISAWFCALHVKYRDLGTLLPVLIQLWMFASPIIYPSSSVPENWRTLYSLNPLVGIIEGFRSSILGVPTDWKPIAIAAGITLALLGYVTHVYYRWEEKLIDSL